MSRGKYCLPTVSRQFLTRNYSRPNCLLKCLLNCLSPTREGKLTSAVSEGHCEAVERQKLSRGNFCPATSRCLHPIRIAGIQSTTLFGDHPFSIKHPQDNFGLQNVNWHPPKCKLTPSKKGLATSNLQFLYRNSQKSPLDNLYLEGANLHFGGWNCLGGGLYRKGGTPKKGGTLASPHRTQPKTDSGWVFLLQFLFPSPHEAALSGPNRAMQPRCAMRFESHIPKSLAMRKGFFR